MEANLGDTKILFGDEGLNIITSDKKVDTSYSCNHRLFMYLSSDHSN
jgi:hypothetical protein